MRGGGRFLLALIVVALVSGSLGIAMSGHVVKTPPATLALPCPNIVRSSPQTFSTSLPVHTESPCPGVVAGTFLGGSNADVAADVAVDAAGNSYITGRTLSPDFPTTPGAYDTTYNDDPTWILVGDAFLAKFNPAGALVFSTFLGGSSGDSASSIVLDPFGNIYLAGSTSSSDFPTTEGALDTTIDAGDAFVAKFDSNGNLLYSTFLGGSEGDGPWGPLETATSLAVDSSGNVYVAGTTLATDFPVTQGSFAAVGSKPDAFVAKLNPDGTALVYSTVIGGEGGDEAIAIALDASGNAYVAGHTLSPDFPVTPDAFDTTFDLGLNEGGSERNPLDVFVLKLDSDATALGYATFLGGDIGNDFVSGIVSDSLGNVLVAGLTFSADFPQFPGSYEGRGNRFMARFDPSGVPISVKAKLEGDARGIELDESGNVYITGRAGEDFWTTSGAYDRTPNGGGDAFVAKLDSNGTFARYSTFLGGGDQVFFEPPEPGLIIYDSDEGSSIAVDPTGNATIVGSTGSYDFPVTENAFDPTYNGRGDTFVIRMELVPEPNRAPVAHLDVTSPVENSSSVSVDASSSADAEDRDDLLEARWDWEDDGVWDTGWSTVKTGWLKFAEPGNHTIRLEIRDTGGLVDNATQEVTISGSASGSGDGSTPPPDGLQAWATSAIIAAGAVGVGAIILSRRRSRKGPPST